MYYLELLTAIENNETEFAKYMINNWREDELSEMLSSNAARVLNAAAHKNNTELAIFIMEKSLEKYPEEHLGSMIIANDFGVFFWAVKNHNTELAKYIIDKCPENHLGEMLIPNEGYPPHIYATSNSLTELAIYMIDKCPENHLRALLIYADFYALSIAIKKDNIDLVKHIIDNLTPDNLSSILRGFISNIRDSLSNCRNKDILKIILDRFSEDQLQLVYTLMGSKVNIYGLESLATISMNLIKIEDLSKMEESVGNLHLIKFYLIFENNDSKRASVVNSITGIDDSQKKVILTEATKRNELFQKNYNFAEIMSPGNLDVVNFSTLNKKGDFKNLPSKIKNIIASFLNGVSVEKPAIFDAPTVKVESPASTSSAPANLNKIAF